MHPSVTQTDPAVARSAAAGSWTPVRRSAVTASFLAWVFDAFDFFLMVFVVHAVAAEFGTPITSVTLAIVLTLAMRPIGAFVFGRAADRSEEHTFELQSQSNLVCRLLLEKK